MKELLEYIIPNIVNNPDEVEITEETTDGLTVLRIKVNPEDMGRVIGKSGKVIKAIRQIARIIALKKGVRVDIDVLDDTIEPEAKASEGEDENVVYEADEEVKVDDAADEEEKEE